MELAKLAVESIELACSSVLKQEIKKKTYQLLFHHKKQILNYKPRPGSVYLYTDIETGIILLVSKSQFL